MPRFPASIALLLLSLPSVVARADAIEGPPACPEGSRGASSHAGTWCEPAPCTSDAACGEGQRCVPWRVCTRVSDVQPGGRGGYDRPPVERTLVVGSCPRERACRGDEEPPPPIAGTLRPGAAACTDATFCVPQVLAELPPRSAGASGDRSGSSGSSGGGVRGLLGGCGCHSTAPGRTAAWSLTLAAVAAALVLRRRK